MIRPPINWSDQPTDRPKICPIRSAQPGPPQEFLILSECEFGVFGHWDDQLKRNRPCTDPHGCICQERAVSTWWKCYLGCQEPKGRLVLVELSGLAWLNAQGVKHREARGHLRGLKITLERYPKTKQGHIIARLYEPSVEIDLNGIPRPPDVKEELQRIWFSRL